MAKKAESTNGRDHLEEAMALLIQNQASFLRERDIERTSSERFSRIESTMSAILRVLDEHGRLLERLPDAIRDKIGFKGPK
jgi:hypothetical protein